MRRSKEAATDRAITGSDFLQLDVGEAPVGGVSAWLAEKVRVAIADGRLPVGSRLPATRVLAAELQVSRGVVTEAYQRLVEDGHVVGRGRGGTVVQAAPRAVPLEPTTAPEATTVRDPGTVFHRAPAADVFDALRNAPARIDLTPGLPDLAAFPRSAWLRAERAVLGELSASALGYGDPRGAPALRVEVARWLARYRGIRADPDDVVVVAGVAQSFALLAQVLPHHGLTEIAVEDPGSFGARQQLAEWGLATPPVPVDAAGLVVSELAASGAPAVLLTPAHQFPTGVVLDGGRRRELMTWAEEGGLVVEDDYDAEHRYDRPPTPALRSLLVDQVCYTGSVSKTLAPALRLGWMLVPRRYRDDVVAAKRRTDLGNAVLPQLVLAELMRSGELERHLRVLRRRHRRRRDAMVDAVRERLPHARVHGAAAGLHLTITLAPDDTTGAVDDVGLAARALQHGVKVHPLSWHRQRPGSPGLVLGYAARTPTEIADAVETLAMLARS